MKRIFLFFIALIGITSGVRAQMNIDLAGYPLVTTGWTYSSTTAGTAAPVDSTFRITSSATTGTASYLYYNTAINMNNWCSWTADFDFKITPSSGTIADGFAFWFLTSPPSSSTGAGIGLPANPNGLVLLFDTYDNYSATGPHIPQISLLGYNGTTPSYIETSATGRLCTPQYLQSWAVNGNWHHVTVTYVLGNVNVYFDYSPTPNMTSTTAYPLTITGYFGFSGSTGAITSTQLIKNVHIVLPTTATPTVTSPVHYCLGDAATPLTASGASPLRWFTSDTATVTALPGAPTPNTSVTGTTTYYVRSGNAGPCISAPDSIKVVVTAPVTPTITGTTQYCTGDTYVPYTVSGVTGVVAYYTTASGGTGTTTPPVVNTSVAGVTNIYVSQVDSGCESPRAHLAVTVSPTPAPPTVTPPVYCQFDVATPLAATGSTLRWYGPGVTPPSSATPIPSTALPHIDTYYVTQTVGSCTSDSARDIVTVKLKPTPPSVVDTSYCQLFPAVALTATGTNLLWYTSSTGGTSTSVAPVPSTATPGITTWYVTQTVNGCESNRSPLNVTTMFLPSFNITQSRPYVCQGDTLILTYSGAAPIGGYFTWTLPFGASFAYGSTSSDVAVMVRFDSLFQQDVILRIGDHANLCANYDTLRISVSPQPTVDPYIQENVCLGDTVALGLTDHSANAATYTWDFDGATIIAHNSNSGGPYKVKWTTPGLHMVKVTAITVAGCKSEVISDTVKVHYVPTASFSIVGNGPLCFEDSVHFRADSFNTSFSYYWTPTHYFVNGVNPDGYGRIENAGYVKLRVTDPFGCYATDSMALNPDHCCKVFFPTAFTPNGDGKNDEFQPVYQGYHRFHSFRIANRWGQTVFESTNNKMAWDGKFNGIPQDMGIYYYFVKYDCGGETLTTSGDVTLVR